MSTPLTLNLLQGSVTFRFTSTAAQTLKAEIAQLMHSMKAIAGNSNPKGRPQPQESMNYQYTGDIFLEIFCNPNIYPSPFAAKVLITLRDDRIRLTSEAELPRLIEDLENYLAQAD
ncbi:MULTISPECIES: hypothetical protein [Cyanophyceae]|uniref:hypothetical protein n=1 Tax=Cyanophyceae TaxID=3028117 RepID=UPI00016DC62A|nr:MULTISPECIES: hypothetical protein [Cyanophyceae]ACA98096.1 conserved hypothetical protein [Picosynechococcus sp. PCC 7002]SMH43070.1 hypothetical protein SAMN06272755_1363 [Picosynechococcus sp. OG1]SMQ79173.1 hypothetical protein SAMN06272774_0642 [Synechococcus sp. 7002]